MIELNEIGTMIKFIKVRRMNLVTISQSRNRYQLIRLFLLSIFKEKQICCRSITLPSILRLRHDTCIFFLHVLSVFGTWAIMVLRNFVTIRQSSKIVENLFYEVIFF